MQQRFFVNCQFVPRPRRQSPVFCAWTTCKSCSAETGSKTSPITATLSCEDERNWATALCIRRVCHERTSFLKNDKDQKLINRIDLPHGLLTAASMPVNYLKIQNILNWQEAVKKVLAFYDFVFLIWQAQTV